MVTHVWIYLDICGSLEGYIISNLIILDYLSSGKKHNILDIVYI